MENRAEGLTVIEGGKAPVVDVGEKASLLVGSKQWAAKIRRRAKELAHDLDLGYMELARILYQVYDAPVEGDRQRGAVFTTWGYTSFGEYAEKELGLHQKKAERLRLIFYTLEVQLAGMEPEIKERVVNLGYSKVRELIRVITLRNAEMWLEQAEHMTYRQLYGAVVEEKKRQGIEEGILGPGGGASERDDAMASGAQDAFVPELGAGVEKETFKQERFDLAPAQLENVLLALKLCGQISGSDKKGHLLDLICTDFLAGNDVLKGDSDNDKRLRFVAKMERTLGLRLIAVDPGAKEIIYGYEALEMVAKDE